MRYFEDHAVGQRSAFGRYEVERDEVIAFAAKYVPLSAHLDDDDLVASGWHVCAMMVRMVVDDFSRAGSAAIGSPGFDGLRWLAPVRPGDILSVEDEVIEMRPSRSRADIGSVHSRVTVLNQHAQPVLRIGTIALVRRRPAV